MSVPSQTSSMSWLNRKLEKAGLSENVSSTFEMRVGKGRRRRLTAMKVFLWSPQGADKVPRSYRGVPISIGIGRPSMRV